MIVRIAKILATTAWMYSLFVDGFAHRWGWLVADFFVPPVGCVRGVLLFFGGLS